MWYRFHTFIVSDCNVHASGDCGSDEYAIVHVGPSSAKHLNQQRFMRKAPQYNKLPNTLLTL